jgi:hypothetical protein
MEFFKMDLQWFGEGGDGAAPAGDNGGSDAAEMNDLPMPGETLADGTKVDAQLAAALEAQTKKHPELKQKYARARGNGPQAQRQPVQQPSEEKTLEQRWEEAKKGEFKDLFGRDVKSAVDDRFKNREDVTKYEPMLKLLREERGVNTNDELMQAIMNDDARWEDKANEMGMTVEGAKMFSQMEEELNQRRQQEQADIEDRALREHYMKLVQQAEALKATVPDFDLQAELQNPEFFRMTSKDVNVPIEAAYFAVHHQELMPQAMAYGIQRGKQQVSQTLQATGRRPQEGAMQGNAAQAAPVTIDPRKLTRQQRDELVRQSRMGKRVTFE